MQTVKATPHIEFAASSDLIELLHDCEEYFDQRADAEYFADSAIPHANEEMRLLTRIREELRKVTVVACTGQTASFVVTDKSGKVIASSFQDCPLSFDGSTS